MHNTNTAVPGATVTDPEIRHGCHLEQGGYPCTTCEADRRTRHLIACELGEDCPLCELIEPEDGRDTYGEACLVEYRRADEPEPDWPENDDGEDPFPEDPVTIRAWELAVQYGPDGPPPATWLPPSQGSPRNLPPDFWDAQAALGHVRQAAWSRGRSADAVLGGTCARTASMWPPLLRLDTGVAPASANFFVILAGGPGSGKTSSAAAARELLPRLIRYPGLMALPDEAAQFTDGLPLGSGEGLAEAYWGAREQENNKGKIVIVRARVRDHVLVYADEGDGLAKLLERAGATLGGQFRSAWTGETIGQGNASLERMRIVSRGTYSLGVIIGFQPSTVKPLLDDMHAGTPQRFTWTATADPAIPEPGSRPSWPGPLELAWPAGLVLAGQETLMSFDGRVQREIADRDHKRNRGLEMVHPLDAHEMLTRAKMAGFLAALTGEFEVSPELWELTAVMWKTSCTVRGWMASFAADEAWQAERHYRDKLTGRKVAEADALDERAMAQAVRSAARHIAKQACKDGCKRRCVTQSIKSTVRKQVSVDDVIERIIAAGYAQAEGDVLTPGRITPP